MKKLMRFSAAIIALAMTAIQMTSLSAFAAEQTIYTGTCGAEGDNITWTYDASTQTMIFSGSGAMNDFLDGEEIPWMSGELSTIYNAKNIIYEEGITDIGGFQLSIYAEDREYYDITIPGSVTVPRIYVPRNIDFHLTYHVKYGSQAYYTLHNNSTETLKNFNIVAEGVAEKEVIPTRGETETGLRWDFDYETATLTLEGVDGETTLVLDERGNYSPKLNSALILGESDVLDLWLAADKIVIGQDFVIPDSTEVMETIREMLGDNSIFENNYINYTVGLMGHYNQKTIYCYKDSQFAQEYESYVKHWSDSPTWLACCNRVVYMDEGNDVVEVGSNDAVSFGDLNMDGNVDLRDAVYMNKHTANIVQLTDAQKAIADCDCDGSVTDADVTTLMEYLMFQIPSLPYHA